MPDQHKPTLEILGSVYGGPGGSPFDDRPEAASGPIHQVTLHGGSFVDAISITYGTLITWHGGPGGYPQNLTLDAGEYILHVEGRAGLWLDSLKLTTNRNRSIQAGGGGGEHFVVPNPDGLALYAIFGHAGNYIDRIQFVFGPTPATKPKPTAAKTAAKKAAAPKKTAPTKAATRTAATKAPADKPAKAAKSPAKPKTK